jgi:endoglucanase
VVSETLYDALYRNLVKGLYYQRCGTEIPAEYGGSWTHETCHDHGSGIASYDWITTGSTPGGYRNTIGGWHDAGDYGKYSTNNAYTVGILLQTYELFPDKYAHDDCGIPESGNGLPDLLDEARWSLEWMLEMQEPSGAVLHRESIATWAGDPLPEEDAVTRYYSSISSDATAMHAAAMATAARVFAALDASFAASCSASAVSAWDWLETHPTREPSGGFVNLHGHTGATYVGGSDTSHRLWAAAELFRLNGPQTARTFVDTHWGDGMSFNGVWYPDSWGDVANLGAFTYSDAPGATASVVSGSWWSIENSTISSCNTWITRADQDGYGCVGASDGAYGDYYWGFTGVLLRYAWTLLQGFRYAADPEFEAVAREQLHYILGRNPLGKTYVTGMGTRPVLHSHGAWNLAAGYVAIEDSLCNPIPYQLVGGPNKADNGDISPYPGRCYEDIADPDYFNKGNWTLNETSVNIQASLIVLAGYFSSGGTVVSASQIAIGRPRLQLMPVRPNPVYSTTTLRWIGRSDRASRPAVLEIFNAAGRRVRAWNLAISDPDGGAIRWDRRSDDGQVVPSGIYFARIRGSSGPTRKVVVLQ